MPKTDSGGGLRLSVALAPAVARRLEKVAAREKRSLSAQAAIYVEQGLEQDGDE